MVKALIAAIFLSQAPIQLETISYDTDTRRLDLPALRLYTDTVVVIEGDFDNPQAPVPYWEYWDCPFGLTAQECVAIDSLLQGDTGR